VRERCDRTSPRGWRVLGSGRAQEIRDSVPRLVHRRGQSSARPDRDRHDQTDNHPNRYLRAFTQRAAEVSGHSGGDQHREDQQVLARRRYPQT